MTVDEFAQVFSSGTLEFVEDGRYQNQSGQVGYRAIYRDTERYLWFSVSNTEIAIAIDEVAAAITTPDRQIIRENSYWNQYGRQGFEATVRSGEHWFMLNAAPDPPSRSIAVTAS